MEECFTLQWGSLVKNFRMIVSSLKETFLKAPNISDMHSNNINFVSSKRG